MRPDSRTDSDHSDDREPTQPAAYPVFTGDREPADIPAPRQGENPFGTPPGGYATPPEPVDEFDRTSDDENAHHEHATGADDSGEHGQHSFADADARTDRSDHGGPDPDEVAVGRASVPGDAPTLDPDEREAVASTEPTSEDFHHANAVATDPADRDDLDVRPTVLHGTGDHGDDTEFRDPEVDRPSTVDTADTADTTHPEGTGEAAGLPDLDKGAGHNVAGTDGYHEDTGFHDNAADVDTDRPSTVDTDGTADTADETVTPAGYHATDATDHPTHHDEEEPEAFPETETAVVAPSDDTATDESHEELKPGDAEVAPVPTFWAASDTDGYRDRWREAQLRFVDDPQAAADEVRGLVGEAAEAVAQALTTQRQDLDAWNGGDGPHDTEQLRVVIQRYRTFFDRLLNL